MGEYDQSKESMAIPFPRALGVPASVGRAAEGLGLRRGAALQRTLMVSDLHKHFTKGKRPL